MKKNQFFAKYPISKKIKKLLIINHNASLRQKIGVGFSKTGHLKKSVKFEKNIFFAKKINFCQVPHLKKKIKKQFSNNEP